MWSQLTANFSDLIFAVSEALDSAAPSLANHQIRTAYVATELARAAGLDYDQTECLAIAALLHDIGALSPEAKMGVHSGSNTALGPHCQRGGKLLREAPLLAPAAPLVDWHHTTMAEHRSAGRSLTEFAVLGAQMLSLADHLERLIRRDTPILQQTEVLHAHVRKLSGAVIHADVVALFDAVAGAETFWLELAVADLGQRLRQRNLLRSASLDYAEARALASVFKDMTDFRTRFSVTHSTGVAWIAQGIGAALECTEIELQQLGLAGLLHDIGTLMVPNAILCKPAKLTADEFAVIQQHPHHTHKILAQVRGLGQVAQWAAYHHERLDGSGYSRRIGSVRLDLGARILAVADVATALAEDRAYRPAHDSARVLAALRAMADQGLLDAKVVATLTDNYPAIAAQARDAQAADEARYREHYATIN